MTSTICDQVTTDGQIISLASEVCRLMEVHQLNLFDLSTQTGIMPDALTHFFQTTNSKVIDSSSYTTHLVNRLQAWLGQFKLRQQRRSLGAIQASKAVKLNPYLAKQRVLINKHQQDAPANMIPITLALTMLQPGPLTRFGLVNKNASGVASFADSFLWNPDQTNLSPKDFLRQTLIDSKLDPNLWQPQLEKQMMKQIQDYHANPKMKMESKMEIDTASPHTAEANITATSSAIVKPAPSDSSSVVEESKDSSIASTNLLKLELDLVHNGVRLQDNILWNPASSSFEEIESVANTYCRELGLTGEFAVKVFWTIHEQLVAARLHPPPPLPSSEVSSLLRDSRTAKHWTPLIRPDPKRHAVIVAQRPPPPYIAHHISAGHRHAIYLGELIDMEQNILPIPVSGLPNDSISDDPSSSAKPDGPESYSFLSCTTKTLRLKRWPQTLDDSETIEPAPPSPAPPTSNRFSLSIPRSSRTSTRPSSSATATTSPSPSSSTIISLKRLRSAMTADPGESDDSMTPIDDTSASMPRHSSDDWDESNIVEEVDEDEEDGAEVAEEEVMMEEEKVTSPPVATETSSVVEATNGRIKLRLRR